MAPWWGMPGCARWSSLDGDGREPQPVLPRLLGRRAARRDDTDVVREQALLDRQRVRTGRTPRDSPCAEKISKLRRRSGSCVSGPVDDRGHLEGVMRNRQRVAAAERLPELGQRDGVLVPDVHGPIAEVHVVVAVRRAERDLVAVEGDERARVVVARRQGRRSPRSRRSRCRPRSTTRGRYATVEVEPRHVPRVVHRRRHPVPRPSPLRARCASGGRPRRSGAPGAMRGRGSDSPWPTGRARRPRPGSAGCPARVGVSSDFRPSRGPGGSVHGGRQVGRPSSTSIATRDGRARSVAGFASAVDEGDLQDDRLADDRVGPGSREQLDAARRRTSCERRPVGVQPEPAGTVAIDGDEDGRRIRRRTPARNPGLPPSCRRT